VQVRLIVNPLASAVGDRIVDGVTARLAAVCDLEVVRTEYPGHARALAAAATDLAVALGGDGTANEVVNGLPAGVGFSMLPGGASSVFARQIGFTDEPLTAAGQLARALAQGHARTIGLGRLDGRRFTFAASVGFDAEAIRAVDDARWGRRGYRRPGDLRVAVALLRALRADGYALHERMTVAGGGRTPARAAYLAVGNQHPYTYFGRLPVRAVPRAGFDSALDAVAVHAARTRDLWLIGGYALVWPRHAGRGSALAEYLHDVRTIEVECDVPTAVQVDGEYVGLRRRVEIGYLDDALRVYGPRFA
jgi:diacylglycerol kinase family enzyme